MKKYIICILALLLYTSAINAQRLMIYSDLRGEFHIKIEIYNSSIILDKMGNIKQFNSNHDSDCEDGDLRLESPHNSTKKGRIKKINGQKIEYDFFTENISRIGDLLISYDFSSKRISKIGNMDFNYEFSTNRIEKIGSAVIKYDFFTNKIAQIGDVKFKYDGLSSQLTYVGNDKFEYEFDTDNSIHINTKEDDCERCKRDLIKFSYDGIDFCVKI